MKYNGILRVFAMYFRREFGAVLRAVYVQGGVGYDAGCPGCDVADPGITQLWSGM